MNDLAEKKVLLLYTAHTFGHQRVAENIAYWLRRGGASVELREVLKSNPSPLVRKFLQVHVWVNTYAPWLWSFLYSWGFWVTMMPLRLLVAFWQKGEIEKIVLAVKPDIVITTQTAPSAVLSVLKKKEKFTGLWGVAFSDYHFHRAWAYPRVDFYLPNIEEQMTALDRLGVPRDRMFRIGLAVPPQEILEKSLALTKLGLPTSARVVLVSSGTLGVGLPHGFIRFIDQLHSAGQIEGLDLRVVVACGRNEELQKQVGELARVREWLLGFGFYSPMRDLYAASDVMVSKPGGLTIAETILLHLPVFVTHMLPGQEKLNMNYLLRHKAVTALYTLPQGDWVPLLVSELKTGKRRQFLEKNVELLEIIAPANLANLGKFVAHLFHGKNS